MELRINRVRLAQKKREVRYGKGTGNQSCTPFAKDLVVDEPLPGMKKKKKGRKPKGQSLKEKEEEKRQEVEEPIDASEEADNRLYLEVEIEGKKCRALFDPGATFSLIGPGLSRHFEENYCQVGRRSGRLAGE